MTLELPTGEKGLHSSSKPAPLAFVNTHDAALATISGEAAFDSSLTPDRWGRIARAANPSRSESYRPIDRTAGASPANPETYLNTNKLGHACRMPDCRYARTRGSVSRRRAFWLLARPKSFGRLHFGVSTAPSARRGARKAFGARRRVENGGVFDRPTPPQWLVSAKSWRVPFSVVESNDRRSSPLDGARPRREPRSERSRELVGRWRVGLGARDRHEEATCGRNR